MRSSQINGHLSERSQTQAPHRLYLNETRKNLAANLERSPLSHSCGYGSADDRPTLFAGTPDRRFFPDFVPVVKYPG